MEGLEPIVEWLNEPSFDWKDYVQNTDPGNPPSHQLLDAEDAANDDRLFDWLWDSNLDIVQQPEVTVSKSEWQRETQALKAENARYGLTVRFTNRIRRRLTVKGFVKGSTVSTLHYKNTGGVRWNVCFLLAASNIVWQQPPTPCPTRTADNGDDEMVGRSFCGCQQHPIATRGTVTASTAFWNGVGGET